jgi:hypothetical protein
LRITNNDVFRAEKHNSEIARSQSDTCDVLTHSAANGSQA